MVVAMLRITIRDIHFAHSRNVDEEIEWRVALRIACNAELVPAHEEYSAVARKRGRLRVAWYQPIRLEMDRNEEKRYEEEMIGVGGEKGEGIDTDKCYLS